MQYITESEFDIHTFPFWSGAEERIDKMPDRCLEYLAGYIESAFAGDPTDTEINDFVWFESDDVLAEAGLYDPETGEYIAER